MTRLSEAPLASYRYELRLRSRCDAFIKQERAGNHIDHLVEKDRGDRSHIVAVNTDYF